MKTKLLLSLCLIFLLSACSILDLLRPAPSQNITQTLDAARTEAVQTAVAEIIEEGTNTLIPASLTPFPSATQTPLPTLTSTMTPTNTATAIPPTATFTATSTPTSTATFTPTATAIQPALTILGVEKNRAVSLQAKDFPKNETFHARIGSASVFYGNYMVAGTIQSSSTGSFKFTVLVPFEIRNVDTITVRLDSVQGNFADVTFKNTDSGQVSYTETVMSPALCEVSVTPGTSKTLSTREDFDAVWMIKNTSGRSWDQYEVDHEFIGGEEMQKYEKRFDLAQTILPGESIKLVVDMLAPNNAGTYTTHWALVIGRTVVCHLPLKIVVK